MTFDFNDLDESVRQKAEETAIRLRARNKCLVVDAIAIGVDLVAMKALLKGAQRGKFGSYVAATLGCAQRTAQNYMNLATHFGDKSEIVSQSPLTVLFKLAAPSTPDFERVRFINALVAGKAVTEERVMFHLGNLKGTVRLLNPKQCARALEQVKTGWHLLPADVREEFLSWVSAQ